MLFEMSFPYFIKNENIFIITIAIVKILNSYFFLFIYLIISIKIYIYFVEIYQNTQAYF